MRRGHILRSGLGSGVALALFLSCLPRAALAETVAVLERRSGVKVLADLPEQLAQALGRNTSLKVIDPREARRRVPGLDAEVGRSSADVARMADLGTRLGADEVLLMAVSQLGDVVLALQRIDVRGRKVGARVADSIATEQAVDEARVLGWLQQLYPPETFKRYGLIRVNTNVDGAQVYLNAKARGQTPLREPVQVLAPGNYRLLVEKPRYLSFQAALTVMPDSTAEVTATLTPEVVATPWYRRWYVWAIVGGVAVAAAATSVAVYYGAFNQPAADKTHVPGVILF